MPLARILHIHRRIFGCCLFDSQIGLCPLVFFLFKHQKKSLSVCLLNIFLGGTHNFVNLEQESKPEPLKKAGVGVQAT